MYMYQFMEIANVWVLQGRKQDELLTVCNQIKEITGIHDEKVIKRAIDACQDENGQFNVENVVAMLVAEDSQVTNSPPKKVKYLNNYMYTCINMCMQTFTLEGELV